MAPYIRWELIKNVKIPVEIFELRLLSAAEAVVHYLVNGLLLKDNEIAFLLKKDPRTIWTFKARAEFKIEQLKKKEPKAVKLWEDKCGFKGIIVEQERKSYNRTKLVLREA